MSNTDHVTVGQLRAYSRGAEATNDARFAKAEALSALSTIINTLIGNDSNKSARAIAAEELAAKLIPLDAKESLNTLQEIADWIQDHPDDAAAMNSAIRALQTYTDVGTYQEAVLCKSGDKYEDGCEYHYPPANVNPTPESYQHFWELQEVDTSEFEDGVTDVSNYMKVVDIPFENVLDAIYYYVDQENQIRELQIQELQNSIIDGIAMPNGVKCGEGTKYDSDIGGYYYDPWCENPVDTSEFVDYVTDVGGYYINDANINTESNAIDNTYDHHNPIVNYILRSISLNDTAWRRGVVERIDRLDREVGTTVTYELVPSGSKYDATKTYYKNNSGNVGQVVNPSELHWSDGVTDVGGYYVEVRTPDNLVSVIQALIGPAGIMIIKKCEDGEKYSWSSDPYFTNDIGTTVVDTEDFESGITDVSDYYKSVYFESVTDALKYVARMAEVALSAVSRISEDLSDVITNIQIPETASNQDISDILDTMYATYVLAGNGAKYDPDVTYFTDNTGSWVVDTSDFEEGVTDVSSYYIISNGNDNGDDDYT